MAYKPKNHVRIITAASLFDGHDASINIMRRILQDMGAEVIHLGHNRSVKDVVVAALQEGAQGIAISSYQGGHMEYFKYMLDLLREAGAPYVKLFGGGGGVIVYEEKKELESYGVSQIFHPDDGRRLGLEGMIEMIMRECDFDLIEAAQKVPGPKNPQFLFTENELPHRLLGLAVTAVEDATEKVLTAESKSAEAQKLTDWAKAGLAPFSTRQDKQRNEKSSDFKAPLVLGITGTGGSGKSSLVDELLHRFKHVFPNKRIGVLCVDPSKQKTGGGLLGDRIRMNAIEREGVYMRSLASRGSGKEISQSLKPTLDFFKNLDFDFLIAETSGIGQGSSAILDVCDLSLYVMTAEFGAQSQLEKIDMIDYANIVTINKADRRGAEDALRDVTKQYRRSRKLFNDTNPVPVFLTQASNFNDQGVNDLFFEIVNQLRNKTSEKSTDKSTDKSSDKLSDKSSDRNWHTEKDIRQILRGAMKATIVPPNRQNYLSEIAATVKNYKKDILKKAEAASELGALLKVEKIAGLTDEGQTKKTKLSQDLSEWTDKLQNFDKFIAEYSQDDFTYEVRGKKIKQPMVKKTLSGTKIPRVVVPKFQDWGERLRFFAMENVPGEFPYTAGVFPLKRIEEEATRMFAGEGPAERTNRRFHFLSKDYEVKRLSTAFDSVTLYGHEPDLRPDIYGKVGESGVSIATLDDMKKLYEGFDLCDPKTSVSMTINGPAPMILAFFMNTAIDREIEKREKNLNRKLSAMEIEETRKFALSSVRGTVQADILKEDQGQNTCIFSIDFALKMMGDIQSYFIDNNIRNFYSVSISGYHIAEAGANPISQLAFTLSNAFTYVEYYRSRGMNVDDFAPNLSFFFSNGLDAEYTVIGRVARRIWAVAMRDLYKANDRSQKLKYHIQTSGRSLHAQEIDFNDIRTTLQALIAVTDNCNSLHTNAFDEAITTPTEASVRRAQAIQMIVNREFGLTFNENPMQGSYFVDWLTDQVEEAVLSEFQKLSERGGVLGSMETQYQRSKIQEESMFYEHLKHSGELPIIGVNTFVDPKTLDKGYIPPKIEMARASKQEKDLCLSRTQDYREKNKVNADKAITDLKNAALTGQNIFAALMEASRYCTLFQMTEALFVVGGQYRRNV
jgi:methylmalonyl-CoA mutase